jgi:hypothetical protein
MPKNARDGFAASPGKLFTENAWTQKGGFAGRHVLQTQKDILYIPNLIGGYSGGNYYGGKDDWTRVTIIVANSLSTTIAWLNPADSGYVYIVGYVQFWARGELLIHDFWKGTGPYQILDLSNYAYIF